jgi:hypothetical protein
MRFVGVLPGSGSLLDVEKLSTDDGGLVFAERESE